MKSTHTLAAIVIAATAALSGCASNNQQAGYGYQNGYQNEAASYGTIEGIQVRTLEGKGNGAGAVAGGLVGALLGNQVGSGSGRAAATVAGAVGGAVVGNNVENNRNAPRDEYQISVRMDNGEHRLVTQDSVYDLRVGNRVRLIDGRLYRY